jgi:hypothetical protein
MTEVVEFTDQGCEYDDPPFLLEPGDCHPVTGAAVTVYPALDPTCAGNERTVTWCESEPCGDSAWCPAPPVPDDVAFPFGTCIRCELAEGCGDCPLAFPVPLALQSADEGPPAACECCDAVDASACVPTDDCDGGGSPVGTAACVTGVSQLQINADPVACTDAPDGPSARVCCEQSP